MIGDVISNGTRAAARHLGPIKRRQLAISENGNEDVWGVSEWNTNSHQFITAINSNSNRIR